MKYIIAAFFVFTISYTYACDCVYHTFCEGTDSNVEQSVLIIERPDAFYIPDTSIGIKYYDVKVIDQLFGFPLNLDSLTVIDAADDCDRAITTYSDTIIVKFPELHQIDIANYPVFVTQSCLNKILSVQNDTVSGMISEVDYSLNPEKMSFVDFLQFYEFECSFFAQYPDLKELQGVAVIQNPIETTLRLKNNLDTDVDFSVFNNYGQLIIEDTIYPNTIFEQEFSNLPKGVYFVRIDDGIGPKFHKILRL
ncbi:T9SS type A sorting domain-containing protein [Portibacter marinus]|uniref:T9SS type A sorting domain-containing protein n=1 Tax=Portibacter marinus TaxID=2898660 RepID=UPI001F1696EB|nr:T9SS type A sorting domain-containing protein [Portibacter marinus]